MTIRERQKLIEENKLAIKDTKVLIAKLKEKIRKSV